MSNPVNSNIHLPFVAAIKQLEAHLNKTLWDGMVLYEDDAFSPLPKEVMLLLLLKHRMQVIKKGKIVLQVKEQAIYAKIPLTVKVKIQYGTKQMLFGDLRTIETVGDITMYTKTALSISDDWQVVTNPKIISYKWGKNLTLKVMGIALDMSWLKERTILNLLPALLPKIDDALRADIDLKASLEEGWEILQKPILLNESPGLWLTAKPNELLLSPLQITEEDISLCGFTSMQLGLTVKEPDNVIDKPLERLPPVRFAPIQANDSEIWLPLVVPYEMATAVLQKVMIGQIYDFGGSRYKIKLEDIKLEYHSSGQLLAKIIVTGSAKGKADLLGTLVYDDRKKLIYFDEINLKIDSRERLVSFTSWLLPNTINRLLKRSLRFPIAAKLIKLENYLTDLIQNQSINEDIVLEGLVEKAILKKIKAQADGIHALIQLKGWIGVTLNEA